MSEYTDRDRQEIVRQPIVPFITAGGKPQPEMQPEYIPDEGQDMVNPEPTQGDGSGWKWVGSPSYPEAQESSDGISDLFEIKEGDFDETDGVDDLVEIDFDHDILDANENGDIEDLVNVSNEDIMGVPPRPRVTRPQIRSRRIDRYHPPISLGGMRG